jgi:hypothetical protein
MNFYLQNTEINLRKAGIYNFFKRKNRKKLPFEKNFFQTVIFLFRNYVPIIVNFQKKCAQRILRL